MLKKLIIFFLLFLIFSNDAFAPEFRKKVVILDTGISNDFPREYLCSEGHRDFSGLGLEDTVSHGTHLAYILKDYINPKKECLLIVKFYNKNTPWSTALTSAYNYIEKLHPAYLNMSFGGFFSFEAEKDALKVLLKNGTIIATAAGNRSENLTSVTCFYYPACYNFENDNFHVVGSLNKNNKTSSFSNYGPIITDWELGEYDFGKGTSFATPVCLGKIIREKNSK